MNITYFFSELKKIVEHDKPEYSLVGGEVRYNGLSVVCYYMTKVHINTPFTNALSAIKFLRFKPCHTNSLLHCTPEVLIENTIQNEFYF